MSTQQPIYEHIALIEEAIQSWKESNNPASIKHSVTKKLDGAKENILLQMLGFEYSYRGTFKIDHCNGRAGESMIGTYIKENVEHSLQEYMRSAFPISINEDAQIALQQCVQDEFTKALHNEFRKYVRKHLNDTVASLAERYTDTLLNEYGINNSSDPVLAFKKMTELINGVANNGS